MKIVCCRPEEGVTIENSYSRDAREFSPGGKKFDTIVPNVQEEWLDVEMRVFQTVLLRSPSSFSYHLKIASSSSNISLYVCRWQVIGDISRSSVIGFSL